MRRATGVREQDSLANHGFYNMSICEYGQAIHLLLPPTKVDGHAALWWLTDSIGAIPVAAASPLR
jgi:hypothetical protein